MDRLTRLLSWVCALSLLLVASAHGAKSTLLAVNATVTGVDYCGQADDLTIAKIHFEVKFENRGRQNRIFLRQNLSPAQVWVTDKSGRLVKQFDLGHVYLTESDLLKIGPVPDEQVFEILKPGQSTTRIISFHLPVAHDQWGVKPGTYIFRMFVHTAPDFAGTEGHIRKMLGRWKSIGKLVTEDFQLTRIEVQVAVPGELRPCAN